MEYADAKKTFVVNFNRSERSSTINTATRRIMCNVLPFFSPWCLNIQCTQQDVQFNVTYTRVKTLETKTVTVGAGLSSIVVPEPNTQVTISVAPGYEWAMIDNPTKTSTYTGPMTVNFTSAIDAGVYVQHVDGDLYTTSE